MNKLSSQDRSSLIRLASAMPKGSEERKAILAGLSKISRYKYPEEVDAIEAALSQRGQDLFTELVEKGKLHPSRMRVLKQEALSAAGRAGIEPLVANDAIVELLTGF